MLEQDRDLARRTLAIDLDQLDIDQLGQLRDRTATVVVVADPADQLRPAARLAEVPGDVRRGTTQLIPVTEPVPQ